jgi:6-phospho-3-hexuloisomerase
LTATFPNCRSAPGAVSLLGGPHVSELLSATADIVHRIKTINGDLQEAMGSLEPQEFHALTDGIAAARKVAVYGGGHEGLVMRAFPRRLFPLDYDVSVVDDTMKPHIGSGDWLILSAGPGYLIIHGLRTAAQGDEAKVVCLPAQRRWQSCSESVRRRLSDLRLTNADQGTKTSSTLPMEACPNWRCSSFLKS